MNEHAGGSCMSRPVQSLCACFLRAMIHASGVQDELANRSRKIGSLVQVPDKIGNVHGPAVLDSTRLVQVTAG